MAKLADMIFTLVYWLIIIRALLSWVNPDPFNPIVQFLYKTTEPILGTIRRILPFTCAGGFDFSPIVAFLIIMFLKNFVVGTLVDLSYRM